MKLSTSPHDGEAINALRAANRVLAARGTSWDEFFDAILLAAFRLVEKTNTTSIDVALTTLLRVMPDTKFRAMICGFQEQWQERNYLSDRQREVLRDAWRQYNPHLDKKPVGF